MYLSDKFIFNAIALGLHSTVLYILNPVFYTNCLFLPSRGVFMSSVKKKGKYKIAKHKRKKRRRRDRHKNK